MNALNQMWMLYMDLGWMLLLLGILLYFLHKRRQVNKARHWVKTKARIETCEWLHQGALLWPKIEYVYEIDDKRYTGEHLFFDTSHQNPASKRARQLAYYVADAFKKDQEIDVFYDPNNPSNAVISTEIPWKLNFIILLLTSLMVFHLTLMFFKYVF